MIDSALEIAERIRQKSKQWEGIGGYSVEAEGLIELAGLVGELADKVATLEEITKAKLLQLAEEIAKRKQPQILGRPMRDNG